MTSAMATFSSDVTLNDRVVLVIERRSRWYPSDTTFGGVATWLSVLDVLRTADRSTSPFTISGPVRDEPFWAPRGVSTT